MISITVSVVLPVFCTILSIDAVLISIPPIFSVFPVLSVANTDMGSAQIIIDSVRIKEIIFSLHNPPVANINVLISRKLLLDVS